MTATGYLAPDGFEHELVDELARAGVTIQLRHERLMISEDPPIEARWAANIWRHARWIPIDSIGHGAKELRAIQRNWAAYAPRHAGRSRLLAERLPHVSARPLSLGDVAPSAPLGSWTLVEPNLLFAAADCSDPFPHGEARIVDLDDGPPSRAYRKLFEAFARAGRWPQPGERCLDLGASPGGWTWLAAQSGASVVAVDKAPLAAEVADMPGVEWRQGSAFALEPAEHPDIDWLLSDVICYPSRLLTLVRRWIEQGSVRNFICTIKFQGPTDHDVTAEFAAIDGAIVQHLHHNKHELTLMILGRGEAASPDSRR